MLYKVHSLSIEKSRLRCRDENRNSRIDIREERSTEQHLLAHVHRASSRPSDYTSPACSSVSVLNKVSTIGVVLSAFEVNSE